MLREGWKPAFLLALTLLLTLRLTPYFSLYFNTLLLLGS